MNTACKRGHEFTPENTAIQRGARLCLACRALRQEKFKNSHPGYATRWSAENSETPSRAAWREEYRRNGKQRAKDLVRIYGITPAQYDEMLAAQGGKCCICRRAKPGHNRINHFMVDHDHKTGSVRGLLCASCNMRLGWFEKYAPSIDSYLSAHRSEIAA